MSPSIGLVQSHGFPFENVFKVASWCITLAKRVSMERQQTTLASLTLVSTCEENLGC